MKFNGKFTFTASAFAVSLAIFIGVSQASAANLVGRSQLRRTVDPSERAATGDVILVKQANGKQIVLVNVRGLGQEEFGVFLGPRPTFDTNCCINGLAPLDRTSLRHGNWSRRFASLGIAPAEFQLLNIFDLASLTSHVIDISQPGEPNIVTLSTNVLAGVTNIFGGITNIVGNSTNIVFGIPVPIQGQTGTVFSALWAPLRGVSGKPSASSFSSKAALSLPAGVPPSPDANGSIRIRFSGSQGRSVFDVRAANLTRGQKYTLWIGDSLNPTNYVLLATGEMALDKSGGHARFLRDTRFADPLPQQAGDVDELSGRVLQIRDGFFAVHLEGAIP